jgi:hypothetical protein
MSAHLILLEVIIPIMICEEYKLLNFSLCSFVNPRATSYLFGQNILLSTVLLNTLRLFRISSFHGGGYVDCCLLVCGAV